MDGPCNSFPHPLLLPCPACAGEGRPITSHWLGEHEGECTFPFIPSPSPPPLSRLRGRGATDHLSLAGGARGGMYLPIHSLPLSPSPLPLARARGDRSPLIGWGARGGNVPSHSFPHP